MTYEFKNLNEVPAQDKPTENTTVMAFENGVPKQIPSGEFGGKGLVVDLRGYAKDGNGDRIVSDMNYDPIYEAFTNGKNVVLNEEHDGSTYRFLFTNGSYHTTA